MPRTCRAHGCAAETSSRYSPYCNVHRGRLRRQGAVDQPAVRKKELASYERLVQARIDKNPGNPTWERLDDVWMRVVGHAKDMVAQRGGVRIRHEYIAAREIVTLGENVPVREVVVCVLAMYLMWEMDPHRFRSDDGFRT